MQTLGAISLFTANQLREACYYNVEVELHLAISCFIQDALPLKFLGHV